jgi:hypothetical protein
MVKSRLPSDKKVVGVFALLPLRLHSRFFGSNQPKITKPEFILFKLQTSTTL